MMDVALDENCINKSLPVKPIGSIIYPSEAKNPHFFFCYCCSMVFILWCVRSRETHSLTCVTARHFSNDNVQLNRKWKASACRSVGDVVVVSQRWKRLMPTWGGAEQNVNKNTMTPAEPRRASCCLCSAFNCDSTAVASCQWGDRWLWHDDTQLHHGCTPPPPNESS